MRTKLYAVLAALLMVTAGPAMAQTVTAEEPVAEPNVIEDAVDQEASSAAFAGEVTVTGSLIPRPTLDALSPVSVLDAEELVLTGTTRIEDLLASLPQVFAGENSTIANGAWGTASVNLRQLGPSRTLALINGRRIAFGDWDSADLNAVPPPLVKRVDVLTGGASAVYGSDAVAGVINFVLDTEFEGVRGGVHYGFYQHDNDNALAQQTNRDAGIDYPSGSTTDGHGINAYIALGGKFGDGRGHAAGYVDYRTMDALTKSARDYFSCVVSAGEEGPYCGGSSCNERGTFWAYNADGSFNGEYTLHWREDGGDGHSFRTGLGEPFNYAPYFHIQRPDQKWSAGGFARYTISDRFEPYLEVMFMRDSTDAQIAPSGLFGNVTQVNCGNPMLSDQQRDLLCTQGGYGPDDYATVYMYRRNVEGAPRIGQLDHSNFRLVVGLRGDLNHGWSYDLSGLQAENSFQNVWLNDLDVDRMANALDVIVDPITGDWVCRSGSDDGCVPWNIFEQGAVTQEAIDYISTDGLLNIDSRTRVLNLTFTGDLEDSGWTLPGATEAVQLAVGAEHRGELLRVNPDEVFRHGAAGFPSPVPRFDGSFEVNELFVEALMPLVQESRGFRDLSLELGYRYSDYSSSGGFDTFKALLNWGPGGSLRLRGGYNRAVRSANVYELYEPREFGTDGYSDPCENDPDTGVPTATFEQCARTGVSESQYGTIPASPDGYRNAVWGGNPLLEPEVADTLTAGVVWTPRAIPGLSVTADYYDIELSETIGSLGSGFAVYLCLETGDPDLCALIHRDAEGTLWLSPDSYVDATKQNIGQTRARGVDLNLSYLVGLGDLGLLTTNLVGTYMLEKSLTDPLYDYDCVGYYAFQCGQANSEWRHRVRVTWETNFNLDLSLTWRRIGSAEISEASPDPDLANPLRMDRWRASDVDKTRAYDWFDLAASYRLNNGIRLTLGINNILDEEPPLMPSLADAPSAGLNLYANYDPLGRYVFTSMRFNL